MDPLISMLVEKAAAGLYVLVRGAIKTLEDFKPELENHKLMVERLDPTVKAIDELNKKLGRTPDEARPLNEKMELAKKLVINCTKVKRWNLVQQHKCIKELRNFEVSLQSYMQIQVPAQLLRDIKEILLKLESRDRRLNGQTGGVDHKEEELKKEERKKINSDVDHKKQKPKNGNSYKKTYPDPTSNELKKEEPKKINSDVDHKDKEEPKKQNPKNGNSDKKIYPDPTSNKLKKEECKKINSDVDHKEKPKKQNPKNGNSDKKIYLDPTSNELKKEERKKINSDVDHKEEPKKIDNGFREFAELLKFYTQKEDPKKIDNGFREFAELLVSYTPIEVPVQPKKINSDVDHKEEPNKVNSDKKIHA